MKKMLSLLAAVGLTATASTAVVACTTTIKAKNVTVKDGVATFEQKVKLDKGTVIGDAADGKRSVEPEAFIKGKESDLVKGKATISYWMAGSNKAKDVKAKDLKNEDKVPEKDSDLSEGMTMTVKDSDIKASDLDSNKALKKAKSVKVTFTITLGKLATDNSGKKIEFTVYKAEAKYDGGKVKKSSIPTKLKVEANIPAASNTDNGGQTGSYAVDPSKYIA